MEAGIWTEVRGEGGGKEESWGTDEDILREGERDGEIVEAGKGKGRAKVVEGTRWGKDEKL